MSQRIFSRLLNSSKQLTVKTKSLDLNFYPYTCQYSDPIHLSRIREYNSFSKQNSEGTRSLGTRNLSDFRPLNKFQSHRILENWSFYNASKRPAANLWTQTSQCVSHQGKHPIPKIPSSKIMRHYDIHGSIANDDSAKQFIYALSSHERKLLLTELEKYRDVEERRSDATKPSRQQLKQVFLLQALPFIGFGFLDNLLMIVAGEYIDVTLGTFLGISTMAAAALGNLISDVGGIGSASYVESIVSKFGVRAPQLTPEQVDMGSTKWASNMGKVIGVAIGCLLGMFPLLFFKKGKGDEEECSEQKS